jgi:hypothetical protein
MVWMTAARTGSAQDVRSIVGWLAALAAVAVPAACASAQSAAARDPMKCERDPNCSRGRSSYADCTRQCTDNPECVARCEQIQRQVDGVGHP